MEETWYYEIKYPGMDKRSEEGFESFNDAYDTMSEAMTELIDEVAEKHPELSDEAIENAIDWEVRPE